MLRIENLTKYYGDLCAVDNLNITLKKGEIFGFIGPNGAGKSTTIKCIMNLVNKNDGSIYIDNKLVDKDNHDIKDMIGYLPSEVNLYDDLKVIEMIKYSNNFYKRDCMKRAFELIKKFDLDVNKKIEDLSLGNLKKLGIILMLMHEPKLLILDEATSGLDPLMQEVFYQTLLEEKKKGTTIFFSSHILSEIRKICDRVGFIKEGKLIKVEDVNDFVNDKYLEITISSEDVDKIINEIKIVKIIKRAKKSIKFLYEEDIQILIKKINQYNIDKLLIEEFSLEEEFMEYYK